MADLDIYNPPPTTKEVAKPSTTGYFRSKYDEYTQEVSTAINEKKALITNAEEKVLGALHPVTRFSPISYDTVKRVSIITLCTYSGVLQGRARAGLRRLLYPLLGFTAGNAACYPKQTYRVSSKILTTGLPIIASAGKASAEAGSAVLSSGSRGVSVIYEKVVEQFTSSPESRDEPLESRNEPEDDAMYEVEILSGEEVTQVTSEVEEVTQVTSDEVASESIAAVEEAGAPDQAVPQSVSDESISLPVTDSSAADTLVTDTPDADSTDKIIPVETIVLPEGDVEPLEGSLGMGDTEHDDMYSTRSSRP